MRIFNTEDIRAIDRRTMETDGVSSLELIDRVAQGVASEIAARWRPTKPVVVLQVPEITVPMLWLWQESWPLWDFRPRCIC